MTDPNDKPLRSESDDPWGVGQRADGTIDVFDEGELPARRAARDAEEAAFADVGDDPDDLSDLDDPLPEA